MTVPLENPATDTRVRPQPPPRGRRGVLPSRSSEVPCRCRRQLFRQKRGVCRTDPRRVVAEAHVQTRDRVRGQLTAVMMLVLE